MRADENFRKGKNTFCLGNDHFSEEVAGAGGPGFHVEHGILAAENLPAKLKMGRSSSL